ncbi:LuxR C-terminal-related transcriptional regulator [Sphingobacterium haloxyli]|uniref:Helix-turn-helix transcriptional regulator n=1 Tax=Sphingobacterium haloxyli TaxID=2100533 RepID=A0A2S9J8G3_9SPHI|nr:LuxR C-terminal-related transcriptional regulator [Sphingobacterium haloxyli]PRD49037.1 helix-turn-helix transcriptional regulator [Sphingobacterium haloxyli]
MKERQHLLSELWGSYPAYLADERNALSAHSVGKHLADILAIGPCYYYTIHVADYSLHHPADTILSIHGIKKYPETLQQIIDLIHPDDIDFVIAAEQATLDKINEIGLQHQLNLKTSYCCRMRVADGSYHLFHHQAVLLATDDDGRLITALHIHTDMQHIMSVNNKIVLISDIGERNNYCQINLSEQPMTTPPPKLSKREMEVLALLAQGLSSQQIGDKLFISVQTVHVHRKHLLKKTNTNNSSNLIKKCIELSLL